MRVVRLSAKHGGTGAVQILQQLAFPRIPYFGAGAANVCDCQQIQSAQIAFVADAASECVHHIRITQILFLRHMAHGEVVLDQEFNQLLIGLGNAVLTAKQPHLVRT